MTDSNKPLMRSLGEFVGHIVKAIRMNPQPKRMMLSKTRSEKTQGNITVRRTTIEEIEIHDAKGTD